MKLLKVVNKKKSFNLIKKRSSIIKLPIIVVYVICFIISRRTKLKTKYIYQTDLIFKYDVYFLFIQVKVSVSCI